MIIINEKDNIKQKDKDNPHTLINLSPNADTTMVLQNKAITSLPQSNKKTKTHRIVVSQN